MPRWLIQHFFGCAIHVLVVPGRKRHLSYSYSGFVCTGATDAMTYPRLERFHNTSADFDSADAAIAAGIGNGKAIAARLLALATEENAPCFTASMLRSATSRSGGQPDGG